MGRGDQLAVVCSCWAGHESFPSIRPCPFSCRARDTRNAIFVISFLFVLPFRGSTKRVGLFVLPQKGRPVPSLFLFFFSPRISKLLGQASLEPITGTVGFQHFGGFPAFGIWLQNSFADPAGCSSYGYSITTFIRSITSLPQIRQVAHLMEHYMQPARIKPHARGAHKQPLPET